MACGMKSADKNCRPILIPGLNYLWAGQLNCPPVVEVAQTWVCWLRSFPVPVVARRVCWWLWGRVDPNLGTRVGSRSDFCVVPVATAQVASYFGQAFAEEHQRDDAEKDYFGGT